MSLLEDQILLSNDQLLSLMLQYIAYLHAHNQTQDPNLLIREIFKDQNAHDRLMQSMFTHMASYGYPEDFPSDGSIFNASSHTVCNQVNTSISDEQIMGSTSFWIEGVSQAIIGTLGIIGNVVAISIYRAGGNKFSTIFYQLLICLLLVHTGYISLSLFMFMGRRIGGKFFIMSYAYILYPLPSLMLHTSTFLTVLLARHRFCAADKPLDYYIAWRFINPKWSALKAMMTSLCVGIVLVIPLFFEPRVETERYMKYDEYNSTHIILVSNVQGTF